MVQFSHPYMTTGKTIALTRNVFNQTSGKKSKTEQKGRQPERYVGMYILVIDLLESEG